MAAITAEMRTQVTQLYTALFGRAPDADGLGYWVNGMAGGKSMQTIAGEMYATTDARSYYPLFLTNEEIVNTFYTNTLGRAPDADGLAYWKAALDSKSVGVVIAEMITAVKAYSGSDAAALDSQNLFNNKVAVGEHFAEVLRSNDVTLAASVLTGVTTAASSVTAVEAAYATAAATATSTTFNLAAGADALSGTNGNDTFNAAIGTLTSSDELHGGLGQDVLIAKIDNLTANNTSYTPVIDGIETITLEARNASASFFMTNISGATTLNVKGITNFRLADLANSATVNVIDGYSADLTLNLATNTATAQALTVNLNNASGADIIADDVGTLTLGAQTNWAHGTALSMSGATDLVLSGAGNISLNLVQTGNGGSLGSAGGVVGGATAQSCAIGNLTAINATGLAGNLTLTLDSLDVNIKGGAGNDTLIMTASLNTNDTIDGGAGSDTIDAILSGGYVRPIVSNVETMNFFVNSAAVTADFRDISGATTLNVLMATGLLVDKAQTSMSTLNINSSDSTANAFTVQFGTAAVASDVTLNLGNGVEGTLQTAAATASGMGIGTITMSGNSGSLTIITNSTAKYSAAAIAVQDFTAVTLKAASANLVVDSAANVGSAQTLALNAAAGKTLTIGNDLSGQGVTNFSISAAQSASVTNAGTAQINGAASTVTLGAGASATIDLLALQMSGTNTLTINAGASALVTADALVMGKVGATAGSGALAMTAININADGDVTIASLGSNTAVVGGTAISLSINVAMTNTAASVGISGFALSDVAGGASASEQSVNISVSGTGVFTFSAAATDSSNVTYHVTTTGLSTAGSFTIDLGNINDTGSVASAVFGSAAGSYFGVDGVDNIELGLGAVTVDGGLGSDTITLSNTANSKVHDTIDTVAGVDTVIGAAAGDVILFAGATTGVVTATATMYLTAAWATGTATTTAQMYTASYTAVGTAVIASGAALTNTAVKHLAIYTAAGDTIIEILGSTGSRVSMSAGGVTHLASGSNDFNRIVLSNKDYTAITAAFQINSTGSGLSITLL